MSESAPVVYGKYQLLEPLARGGMAEVFKAKSHGVEGFEKVLVIKRILPELSRNAQFVEMFINEAKIAVTLSHANIVQVFDLGRADGSYFIAMEYVAGHDLATMLRRSQRHNRPLPPELAVYVVSEVAKGLDYAHRRRDSRMRPLHIIHRDVSPHNVLLSYEGEVKLTDFGIAKARTTVETDAGVLKGKYAYMAPEQAAGAEVDPRADLFGLGTVLYEALSGHNPFQTVSSYDTLQNVRAGACPPVHHLASGVPEELSDIVAKAMSPDPESRHPNAGRLYEDLIQFLYSSGRRVGAHDLSRYLGDLREASEAGGEEADQGLEGALSSDVSHEGAGLTPAEVPRSKSSSAPGVGRARKSTGSGVAPPHAERRDVTALSILSSSKDRTPESTIHSLIRRFGGVTVEQRSTGEGRSLVVLFGVSDPDGRDSEAATRCALRISRAAAATADERTGPGLSLAVHAGRVLMNLDAEMLKERRYDRILREVDALLESSAPGRVLVSGPTEPAIRHLFRLSAADETPDAFWVSGERTMAEAFGQFVGRRNELRQIGEVLAVANRGKGRVVGIVGEAGTGKSRLLAETIRRLSLGGHDVGVYLATLARRNRDVPLAACQEMLRVVLGIDELDPEPIIRNKVTRLRELGLTAPELHAVESTLGLGAAETSGGKSGGRPLRAALARMATRLAEDRLTVFVFDGLESMDEETQGLLNSVLADARHSRIVVALSYRPGFVNPWSDLSGYHEVELGPLNDEDVMRLTASRLGTEEVPLPLLRDVTAKSGGNPLYVEEYLKALQDAGAVEMVAGELTYRPRVAEVEVPKTLRGMVSARMSRLGPVQRHLLQIASVVGPRFAPDVLSRVSAEDMSAVTRALTVLEKRGITVRRSAAEYAFTHELVAEVLREGLTVEARKEIHGAVAAAVEALYPQRTEEMAERLAEHWRQAGDRSKSVDYLVRSADRLESEHALDGAIHNLNRAIDMLGQIPSPDRDRVLALYRRIGDLCFRSRALEQGAERMAAALELAEGLGRDEYVARFSMMRGRLLANANRFQEGRQWLSRARKVAKALGNRGLLRDITLATAEADTKNGQYSSAIGLLQEALSLSRDTGDLRAQIRCLTPLSLAHGATGDQLAAFQSLEEARRLAGMHPDRFTDCELLKTEALIHAYAKSHEGSIDASARALELAKEYGFYYEAAVNAHNLGEGYLRTGDYKRAFASLRYSYELARDQGFTKVEYINLRVLGLIDAVRFGSEEGRERIREAAEYAQENDFVWDLIQSKYLLAIADHALGHLEEARRGFRATMRLADEHGDARYREDAEQALRALEAGEPVSLPT